MARAQRLGAIGALFAIVYLAAFFELVQVPFISEHIAREIVPVFPWWLLVTFGSYSLWSLGWGIANFRDCPEAYEELMTEISQAKNELRGRGVSVD